MYAIVGKITPTLIVLIILYVVYKYRRCFSLPNHVPNVNKSLDSEWLPFIEA
jgi:hypothetical protein